MGQYLYFCTYVLIVPAAFADYPLFIELPLYLYQKSIDFICGNVFLGFLLCSVGTCFYRLPYNIYCNTTMITTGRVLISGSESSNFFLLFKVVLAILVLLPFHIVQKRVNIASLRLLTLEEPACKFGPWLASGNLAFKTFPK